MGSKSVRAVFNMSSHTLKALWNSWKHQIRDRKAETNVTEYLVLVVRIVFDMLQTETDDGTEENNTSLTFQLSASKDQSTAKKYRKRHGWLQLRRDEDVHFICFFSFTTWDSHYGCNPED